MRLGILLTMGALALCLFVAEQPAAAAPPQTTMGNRFNNASDSFFENVGVGFGFSIPSGMPNGRGSAVVGLNPQGGFAPNINFNGVGPAPTPFGLGGSTPGATTGFAVRTPLGTAFITLSALQGSDRGMVSQGGSVTVINGGTGMISDTSLHPFVTSVIPVVGDNDNAAAPGDGVEIVSTPLSSFIPANPSVLGERLHRLNSGDVGGPRRGAAQVPIPNLLAPASPAGPANNAPRAAGSSDPFSNKLAAASASSAGQPATSVSEIRAQLAAEDAAAEAEFREALDRAQQALDAGKPNVARIYYQQVIRRANGPLKQQALDGLKAISSPSSSPSSSSGSAP